MAFALERTLIRLYAYKPHPIEPRNEQRALGST